jgi:hypothetical protein
VSTLVGLSRLGVGNPGLAARAHTSTSVLEVGEDVLHKRGLGGEVCSATMEVARKLRARSDGAASLHSAAGSDDGVLLAVHGVVEEVRVGSGHLCDRGSDGNRVGILLWAVSTGTRAHVAVLCSPRFEPVGADGAAGAVGCDLVQMKFDDQVSERVQDIRAAPLRAGEHVFAGRSVVDGYGSVVRFDILHLITSQSLARNELGGRKGMGGDLRLAPWVVLEDRILLRRSGVCGVCGLGVRVVGHCVCCLET